MFIHILSISSFLTCTTNYDYNRTLLFYKFYFFIAINFKMLVCVYVFVWVCNGMLVRTCVCIHTFNWGLHWQLRRASVCFLFFIFNEMFYFFLENYKNSKHKGVTVVVHFKLVSVHVDHFWHFPRVEILHNSNTEHVWRFEIWLQVPLRNVWVWRDAFIQAWTTENTSLILLILSGHLGIFFLKCAEPVNVFIEFSFQCSAIALE